MDSFQFVSRAKSVVLGNKSRKKLGTLTDSARAWTVRTTSADHPRDHFAIQHMPPAFWRS
jgi:hypothetical protein